MQVSEVQKLCGFLNFLCKCDIPGRVFLRRMYLCGNNLLPHHHVKLSTENKLDLMMWKNFLEHPAVVYRPFMEVNELTSELIDMYSDSSRNFSLGFGAYCGSEWTSAQWDRRFMEKYEPSIEFLELYAVTVAVLNWICLFQNRRITLFCDNQAVVNMINNSASKCKRCMVLLRLIVLEGLIQNVRINAKHVKTNDNGKADALSRLDFKRFWRLVGTQKMNRHSSLIPEILWPMTKIWWES